jgi:hypothetical protein
VFGRHEEEASMNVPQMWGDVESLRSLSAWFQGISIALVFVSGLLQIGRLVVDRREKVISAVLQAEKLNPTRQPVRTGTCTVELVVESNDAVNTHYMDAGGYFAFGKGHTALMTLAATQSDAKQTGGGEVVWRGVLSLDATDASIGKPIQFLRDAEYGQIGFAVLAAGSKVKKGRAIVTLNSLVRIELSVPPQVMDGDRIMIPGINSTLADVLK